MKERPPWLPLEIVADWTSRAGDIEDGSVASGKGMSRPSGGRGWTMVAKFGEGGIDSSPFSDPVSLDTVVALGSLIPPRTEKSEGVCNAGSGRIIPTDAGSKSTAS